MPIAKDLFAAMSEVAPLIGLSIGDTDDKQTWRVDFADNATVQERAAALAILESFDPEADRRTYRDKRAAAYIVDLRKPGTKETPAFQTTVGDVLDVLITQVEVIRQQAAAPMTSDYKALVEKIAAIKAQFPK